MSIPDFATHYHLADKAPFLNLSDLDESELEVVVQDLARRRKDSGLKRVVGRKYMELRRLTEVRLRELFVEAGGKPERAAPHYFCLGACEWFRRLAPDMREIVIPLSELPTDVTSLTYPDSFEAMGFGPRFGLPYTRKPYHDRAYRLEELAQLVNEHGLPNGAADEDYDGYHLRPFEKFVEVQVWSDEPLRRFLPPHATR